MLKFLKRLVGREESPDVTSAPYTRFTPGDYIYTTDEDGYQVSRVLEHEPDANGVHLTLYNPVKSRPTPATLHELVPFVQHVPMSVNGLKNPQLICHRNLSTEDLSGFYTYLQHTDQAEYIPWHYLKRSEEYSQAGNHQAALDLNLECTRDYPNFFQAYDNAAFAHMSLGQYEAAIPLFQQSLELQSDNIHAIFSIGECLFRLEQYSEAQPYFKQALELQPDLQVAKEFLAACGNER